MIRRVCCIGVRWRFIYYRFSMHRNPAETWLYFRTMIRRVCCIVVHWRFMHYCFSMHRNHA